MYFHKIKRQKLNIYCIVEQQKIHLYFKVCQQLITNPSVTQRETESKWKWILSIDTKKQSTILDKRMQEET